MNMRSFLLFLFFGLMASDAIAQQDSTNARVEDQLERALEEADPDENGMNAEQLTQFLEDLAANPININSAGLDDLLQIPGMNMKMVQAIISYRNEKPFESKEELLKVRGIGQSGYRKVEPYITVGAGTSRFRELYMRPEYWLANNKIEVFSRYQQNLEEQRGYQISEEDGGFLGSPIKYYQRIRMTTDHLSVNLTQEKDPGETLSGFTDFDYTSGHLALKNNGKLKDLVIGDYSLSFGQGLVLWTGGSFGKGREVISAAGKNERGIKPYSSAQETDFFRGIATTFGEEVEVTAFYSSRPRTASIINADTTRFPTSTGFHRTLNEQARRNNITQTVVGGRVRMNTRIGLIGVTGYKNTFSSYIRKGASLHNLHDFEGSENAVAGMDYRGYIGNTILFGEIARSQNGGMGGIAGLESSIGEQTEFSIAYRNYSRNFQSFLGDGFGEISSGPNNEEGFYTALKYELNSTFSMSAYFDQYKFNAPRFGTTQSTQGFDVLGLMEMKFTPRLSAYLLLRNEIKEDDFVEFDNGVGQILLADENRASVRAHLEFWPGKQVRLRSRAEWVRYQSAGGEWESGFLAYQDIRLHLWKKLRIDARTTVFETDSFDARIYQFESDLLYVMSNTMLSGRGQRGYVVIKYDASRYIDIWLKYGVTAYEDVHVVGSGLNESAGNTRSSIGLQVRIQI